MDSTNLTVLGGILIGTPVGIYCAVKQIPFIKMMGIILACCLTYMAILLLIL